VCGDTNENSKNARTDFDLQYTRLGAKAWKLVSGIHAQQQRVTSETYYDGTVSRSTYQLFANFEYRFLPKWSATLAGSQEYEDHGNRDFSPRVALLYLPTENQSFRAVYSEAIRTPDLFENEVNWGYTARNLTPPINGQTIGYTPRTVAPGNLREERIRSQELGYYSLWFNRRLAVDVKLFHDDLNQLISETLTFGDFHPDNNSSQDQEGAEIEADFRVNEQLRLRMTYASINWHGAVPNENSLTPDECGSAAVLYSLPGDWQLSTLYYYAYPVNNSKFTRWDTRIAKRLPIFSGHVTVSGVVQHYFYKYADLFRDNLYDGPNRVYVSVDMTF
jgi:iron complex outermembrane receptor protein